MPLIEPKKDESEEEFISRCMSNDVMNEEYPDQDMRAAVCYSQWKNRNKDKSSKDELDLSAI